MAFLLPLTFAQDSAETSLPPDLQRLDAISKVAGTIIGAVVAVIGIPAGIILYRKTRAEIRKLDLEAQEIEARSVRSTVDSQNDLFSIQSAVNIRSPKSELRLWASMYLMMEFIMWFAVYQILNSFLGLLYLGVLEMAFRFALGVFVFVPMAKNAKRIQHSLCPTGIRELLPLEGSAPTNDDSH